MANTATNKAYDIRACQTKTLAVRILQGYEITKTKCTHCGVPLMKYQGNATCVICPKLVDTTGENEEDGGVEIINNLVSGSMLGSMSSSVHSEQSEMDGNEEGSDNNAAAIPSSYSIESETDYLSADEADESSVNEAPKSVDRSEREEVTAPPPSETKKDNHNKNILFMKMIGEMAQSKKKQKEQLELRATNRATNHVSFSQATPALKSPAMSRKNAVSAAKTALSAAPILAGESPRAASKRMGINNIAGDESAKRCYMPAWESKMNSVTNEGLEGKIKTIAHADNGAVSNTAVEKTSQESRNDDFFREIRQKAATKQKVDPFQDVRDEADNFPKVDPFQTGVDDRVDRNTTSGLQPINAKRNKSEDIEEKEFKLQQQRYESAKTRKMKEKEMEESMTNHSKSIEPSSAIPLDEMKATSTRCMKGEKVPEPFDETKAQSPLETDDEETQKVIEKSVLAKAEKLLKSTHEVLGVTKTHLPSKSNQTQKDTKDLPSSSDSIADSMKEHSRRIVALETKTLQKYTNMALKTTNPNSSSASLKSLTTAEKDKRKLLRRHVVELEAEALRKHSEAATAALHARQALDKMMQIRKQKDSKQSKFEDLSISSSISTRESRDSKDETAIHRYHSVESASLSQYSGYQCHQSHEGRRGVEGASILTPQERRSHLTARDSNPPDLNIRNRTHSSEYRVERDHPRSRSVPRSRMPPNIMLPSLHSASPRHNPSPSQKPSKPHLLPYSPRTAPRKSSQPTQHPFPHRPYSPSPHPNINGSFNIEQAAPLPYKYHGSMTPRTVHEQQRFDFRENQLASRNFDSMMLASNQTVQERMMEQQQPRPVYSDNRYPMLNKNMHYYDPEQQMMNRQYQERMINQQQPRMVVPAQMVPQQQPRFDFPGPHFDSSSPKMRFSHPYGAQFGEMANAQYVNPNVYMQDGRNDFSSMRYDGNSMRW